VTAIGSSLPLRPPGTAGRWSSWRRGPAADSPLKAAAGEEEEEEEEEVVAADSEEEVRKN
jgi:hypothetical protein